MLISMKAIHYIRPTSRVTLDQQRKSAGPYRDGISAEVVGGDKFDDALKMLRRGNCLLVHDLATLGRGEKQRQQRIDAVIAKGSYIVTCNGLGRDERRAAHNRTDPETLEKAKAMWTGDEYRQMTNGKIAEAVGLSVVTLHREFGPRGRDAGRPKKQRN